MVRSFCLLTVGQIKLATQNTASRNRAATHYYLEVLVTSG